MLTLEVLHTFHICSPSVTAVQVDWATRCEQYPQYSSALKNLNHEGKELPDYIVSIEIHFRIFLLGRVNVGLGKK